MKRKILLGILITGILIAGAYSTAAWWIGKSTEKTIQKQVDWLNNSALLSVKSHTYQRGWFSSTATTVIHSSKHLQEALKQKQPVFEFTYKQHIKHGPFPLLTEFNFFPYKAVVSADVILSADIQKEISRILGDKKPINIVQRIAFNDDAQVDIDMPGYEQKKENIKSVWSGFKGSMQFSGDLSSRLSVQGNVANAFSEVQPIGNIKTQGIYFSMDSQRGKTGVMLGNSLFSLDNLVFNFFDPDKPLSFVINKLSLDANVSEKAAYLDTSFKINLDKYTWNQTPYGPIRFVTKIDHLHGPTWMQLEKEFDKSRKGEEPDYAVVIDNLQSLLEHQPTLSIPEWAVKTQHGDFNLHASLAIPGYKRDDPMAVLMSKVDANVYFSIARPLLKVLIAEMREIEKANAQLNALSTDDGIDNLIKEKLLRVDKDQLVSDIVLKEGKLTINGQLR